MASLSMVFTDRANPRLIRVEFRHNDLWATRGRERERVDCLCPQSPRLTAGPAAIALLAVRARLSLLEPSGGAQVDLKGRNGTPASSLHACLEKLGQHWHGEWFGFDAGRAYLIGKCFLKSEPGGRFVVWLNETLLPRDQMTITFDHQDVSSDAESLRELEKWLLGTFWNNPELTERAEKSKSSSGRPSAKRGREIHVAILRGADLSYISDIADAFKDRLKELLGDSPEYLDRGVCNALRPWSEYSIGLSRHAQNIVDAPLCDYYVAVGTQACGALRDALGKDRFGRTARFLFLGVTSPIKMGLVEGLQHRDDDLQVAGVGYNDGEVDAMVQRMFKKFLTDDFFRLNPKIRSAPRLTFTYRRDLQQDVHHAGSLRGTEFCQTNELEIRELADIPTENDLEGDRIHFGGFTFEVMFQEDRQTRELLSNRAVIATTRANVENGWAAMGVSVDDREIGWMGAEMLARNIEEREPLGRMPIPCPALRHWVHRGAAHRLGLILPDGAIDTAEEVFE
jgi:hypothetical protein